MYSYVTGSVIIILLFVSKVATSAKTRNLFYENQAIDSLCRHGKVGVQNETTNSCKSQDEESRFTIELAIICDKDFGDLFGQTRTKILEYWKVFIWDVNNRLKTITTANFSIHITQLHIMSSYSEQPFIEISRDSANSSTKTINLGKFLQEFAEWTYKEGHAKRLTGFDIAMGVTGLPFSGKPSGWGYHNGTCDVDAHRRKNFGVLVLSDMGDFRIGTVSHELGHLLGAKHDYNYKDKECRNYIMDYSNWRGNTKQFNFSKCSSNAIGKFVEKCGCLKRKDFTGDILYDADEKRVIPPSIKNQCERVTKSSSAFAWSSKSENGLCERVICSLKLGNGTKSWKYTPVDNSPCKESGFCNRGKCRNGDFVV